MQRHAFSRVLHVEYVFLKECDLNVMYIQLTTYALSLSVWNETRVNLFVGNDFDYA